MLTQKPYFKLCVWCVTITLAGVIAAASIESEAAPVGDSGTSEENPMKEGKNMTEPHRYVVRKVHQQPALDGVWDSPAWQHAQVAEVAHFHPKSSDHRPTTHLKLLYDANGIYVFFRVTDRYVLSTRTTYQEPVYRDACVEFFVQPKPGGASGLDGYLNFEMNSGGTLLLHYNVPSRKEGEPATCEHVPWSLASQVRVYHSLPKVVSEEIKEPVTWCVQYFIPFSLLERYVGPLGNVAGQAWRANFYKCAEDNSHPHWSTWSPIGEALNFHQPQYFGVLCFEV